MTNFTKKLAIVASLVALSSGQFVAFGSNSYNDDLETTGKQLVVANPVVKRQLGDDVTGPGDSRFLNELPVGVMKRIFLEASKVGADPRKLRLVGRYWAHSMRYDIPMNGPAITDMAGIPYMNPNNTDNFMEDCMRLYMDGIVARGVLYYKKGVAGAERSISFSADGTAILADCEGMDQYQVYTLNEEHLKLVRGANENKVVTFFGPFHKARHLLPVDAKGTVSDVVVIWKWGNNGLRDDRGGVLFAYLIINPKLLGAISMYSNYEQKSERSGWKVLCGDGVEYDCLRWSGRVSCLLVNQN